MVFKHKLNLFVRFTFLRVYTLVITSYKIGLRFLTKCYRSDLRLEFPSEALFRSALFQYRLQNIVLFLGVEENLTVDQVRGTFFEKVLNDRNSLGEFTFEKLWFRLDSYFGVTFFRWDQTYDLRYHIRSYDYHGRLAVPNPCEAPNLKRILRRLIHKRWWRRHSPWELLVIPNFRLQSDPDNFKTVLVLRFHPSLLNTEETQVLLGNLFGETFPESGWVRDRDLHWSTPFGNVLAVGSPLQAPLQLTDN